MGDRLATIDTLRKAGSAVPLSAWGELGPYLTQVSSAWAESFHTKWRLHPSSRFATTNMGPKLGAVPLLGGAATPSNTTSSGPRPTSVPSGILVHPTIWPQRTLAEHWGCAPLGEGELGPHLTQCDQGRSRTTCMPSFILIHPTIWPQYTNVTDRQIGQTDRQDRTGQTTVTGSIGRTVLQTVAKKLRSAQGCEQCSRLLETLE